MIHVFGTRMYGKVDQPPGLFHAILGVEVLDRHTDKLPAMAVCAALAPLLFLLFGLSYRLSSASPLRALKIAGRHGIKPEVVALFFADTLRPGDEETSRRIRPLANGAGAAHARTRGLNHSNDGLHERSERGASGGNLSFSKRSTVRYGKKTWQPISEGLRCARTI
jgi:hypothetical protein